MENTEKSKLLQEENNHANNNLGITQSSGLDRHSSVHNRGPFGNRIGDPADVRYMDTGN